MVSRAGGDCRWTVTSYRQLPITGFAHKTAVIGDGRIATGVVLAAHDVSAESRRTAALDRAHHLELSEAHVPVVGLTPCGPVVAQDIRDLQGLPAHAGPALCRRPLLWQRQPLEGAHHGAQHVGGDVGVAGCRVQLGMAQRPRAIMRPFYVIEIEGSVARDPMLAAAAEHSALGRPAALPLRSPTARPCTAGAP